MLTSELSNKHLKPTNMTTKCKLFIDIVMSWIFYVQIFGLLLHDNDIAIYNFCNISRKSDIYEKALES